MESKRDSEHLLKKQKRQMEKIRDLIKKIGEYEESGIANVAALNLDFDERDTIKRALICHLMFLQTDSKRIRQSLKEPATEEKEENV